MKYEILHIPGELPSTTEKSTVDILASTVEPKLANILIRKLNQIYPLEDLRHVKRVRRKSAEGGIELSAILCLSTGLENLTEGISEELHHLIKEYQLNPFKAKVAKFAATSREEWEEQCKLWPTSYHPPNNIDDVTGFSEEDSQLIFSYIESAIRLATSSHAVGKIVNAAVIVDPSSQQVIASACDETCSWPGPVCSMRLELDNCNQLSPTSGSQFSSNGVVNSGKESVPGLLPDQHSEPYTDVSCLHPWGWMAQRIPNENPTSCRSNNLWHPLRHAALVAIEKAAARDRKLFPGSGSSKYMSDPEEYLQDFTNSFPAKRHKTNNPEDEDVLNAKHTNGLPSELSRPYLCTGFDMYLVWEPCTMCAMALVHQRIRRIFYAFPNLNAGSLGSVYRLQGEKSLNHHYSVFRVLVPENTLHENDHGRLMLPST